METVLTLGLALLVVLIAIAAWFAFMRAETKAEFRVVQDLRRRRRKGSRRCGFPTKQERDDGAEEE